MPSRLDLIYARFIWNLALNVYLHGWRLPDGMVGDTPNEIMGDYMFVVLGGITGYGEPEESYGFLHL